MQDRYEKLLDSLLAMTDETEVVEFNKSVIILIMTRQENIIQH